MISLTKETPKQTRKRFRVWSFVAIAILVGLSFLLISVHHHNDLQSESQCPICAHGQLFTLPHDFVQAPTAAAEFEEFQPAGKETSAGLFVAGHFLNRAPPALVLIFP